VPRPPAPQPWHDLLSDEDRARLERARFGRRVGFGASPAVIAIDVQNYMVGPASGPTDEYPSGCGEAAHRAVARLAPLLAAARESGAPVVYTRFELARDGSDIGVYGRKRDLLSIDGWCLAGSPGAEIVPEVAPLPGDLVLVKKKPSAFFGTPLLSLLVDRGIDTLVVAGGATSNCVRATAVDAASYNLRTIVVADCVFDRFDLSHRVALFDLDRQFADVVESEAAIAELRRIGRAARG